MKSYLKILDRIYNHGEEKVATRVESDSEMPTIGIANAHFTHDLSRGFPLITTRKMSWKNTFGELRSFLLGDTHNSAFVANGCNFWTDWAKDDGDLGPIYGRQWNNHGQLEHVLHCLRERPTDRRMVVSAWRPDEHSQMALRPCHLMWVVTPYSNKINLAWIQRSCDFPVGVPHNIASYALLTHLLAGWAELEVGTLDCIFCDAHIYKNQLGLVGEQLKRRPLPLCSLSVNQSLTDFHDWSASVVGYESHKAIKYEVTV